MQFLLIKRRDGEEIPINPAAVSYVRRTGNVTGVHMADGASFRIASPVEEVMKAIEHAADASPSSKRHVIEAEPIPTPGAPAPAPGTPPAAEVEEPELEAAGEGKAAHDDGEPAHRGARR
jgi:hypothetical protein